MKKHSPKDRQEQRFRLARVPLQRFAQVFISGQKPIRSIIATKMKSMKTEFKVLLYLKRNGQDAEGLCPLMGRITVKGKTNSVAQFACKFKVNPNLWNATSQRCTGKSKVAVYTNREIEKMLLLLRQRYNELLDMKADITAEEIKNTFQGIATAQATLLGLFREHNEEYALRVGVNRKENSFYQYKNTYHHVAGYITDKYKVSDIPVKALDGSFIESFELYLRIDKGMQTGSSIGHVQRLKHIVQTAVYRGILSFNPFKEFTPLKPKQKQLYLTREELEKLLTTTFDTPNRNFTRDMFLFSAFTGICYCDMCNLRESNIVKADDGSLWIETKRQKTGTPENVRLLDIAITIIEKYKGMAPDGKLFPMLHNTSFNPHLKKIAKQCGIDRNLCFHQARHTFASVVCISQGVPIETVSKIMGHRNISTTQRYAKITQEKIDRDVTALSFNIEDKFTLQGIDSEPSHILKDVSRRKYRPSKRPMTKSEKRTIITDK